MYMNKLMLEKLAETEELYKNKLIYLEQKHILDLIIIFENYELETGKKVSYEEFKEEFLKNAKNATDKGQVFHNTT